MLFYVHQHKKLLIYQQQLNRVQTLELHHKSETFFLLLNIFTSLTIISNASL